MHTVPQGELQQCYQHSHRSCSLQHIRSQIQCLPAAILSGCLLSIQRIARQRSILVDEFHQSISVMLHECIVVARVSPTEWTGTGPVGAAYINVFRPRGSPGPLEA